MATRDLFGHRDVGPLSSSTTEDRVTVAARRLAIRFADEADVPARYSKRQAPSGKTRKVKEDAQIESRFRAHADSWRRAIETMLAKIGTAQAWRFIDLYPQVTGRIDKATDCSDFCDFVDYLILRRDKEQCGSDELGRIAMLSLAFQQEIEKCIST
jgi:hypothetical protein